jgi:hypothetical protein
MELKSLNNSTSALPQPAQDYGPGQEYRNRRDKGQIPIKGPELDYYQK